MHVQIVNNIYLEDSTPVHHILYCVCVVDQFYPNWYLQVWYFTLFWCVVILLKIMIMIIKQRRIPDYTKA